MIVACRSAADRKTPRLSLPFVRAADCEGREEAFDRVEPGGRCWREMERPSRMAFELPADVGMLMGGVVVDDGVDRLSRRNLFLNDIEEANELLVAMALHVAADHRAVEDVHRGEQRRW